MSELRQRRNFSLIDDQDLTTSIRQLSSRDMPEHSDEDEEEETGLALLICKDGSARKWGTRWLRQAGFDTTFPDDLQSVLQLARSSSLDVVVVDASMRLRGGVSVFEILQDARDLDVPMVALCANDREVSAAIAVDVEEVIRKPFNWQLVGRRARRVARAHREKRQLDSTRDALRSAILLAEKARLQLRSRESFEPITGMPNSAKFDELLKRGMQASQRDGSKLAVFVIGLNRFRLVIEAMGQESANLVLAEVGQRLSNSLLESSDVQVNTPGLKTAAAASLDSARFGMMLTCSNEHDELTALLQDLIEKLSRPVQVAGQTVYVSACVGAALYPEDAEDVDSLLQRADNAMRDAQSRGGGFRFHCAETDAAAARRLKVEHLMHEALERGELSVAYQPIVEIESGRICGAEALLRWYQPDKSQISPAEFVPIAEDSGLIIPIGEFVLDAAYAELDSWHRDGHTDLHVSVNVSRSQLMSGGFVQTVARILEKYDVNPGYLDLELSERGVLSGNYDVLHQLHALKALGVELSIDDFGAGESAIVYLKDLPVGVMKIDRSYIDGLTEGGKSAALTSAMITLGQHLDLTVVAEGVETAEQLQMLVDYGCDRYQGYLRSPAIDREKFRNLLADSR